MNAKRAKKSRVERSGMPAKRSRRKTRKQFHCVNDGVPKETTDLLRTACEQRDVDYLEVGAPLFDYDPLRCLTKGDLLYRPAVSLAAQRVEQFLYAPGVATFYADRTGPCFGLLNPTLVYERAGLPIPRTLYCSTTHRATLRRFVERLGGFPVVMKMAGGERGVG